MKLLYYSIIVILIFSTSLYLKPIWADDTNGIEIKNIQPLPPTVIIGQTFKISATLVNNSIQPIFVQYGSCKAPFSVTFDNHVLVNEAHPICNFSILQQKLNPGENTTVTSPSLDLVYKAIQNGTVKATMTFPYQIWNQTIQSNSNEIISEPFSFTIYGKTHVPTLAPSDNQAIIDVALAIPDLQKWSNNWQLDSMAFMTAKNQPGNWQYAIVYLKASSSSSIIPCDSNNDWSAMVMIDRTTMKVIQATYPTMESHSCNYATGGGPSGGGPNTYGDTTPKMGTPLQQFKSGVSPLNVKCSANYALIIKKEDGSPACMKLDVAYVLIKRGWATSESAYPGGDSQFALYTNSTIMPAHLPRSSGLQIPYDQPSRVINYSGFGGVYNETFQFRGTQNDYVLKPGSTGIITFKLEAVSTEQQGQNYPISLPKSLNLTNYAIFYHEVTSLEDLSKYPGVTFSDNNHRGGFTACSIGPTGRSSCIGGGSNPIEAFVTDHPGIDILFEPPSEVLPLGINATSQVVTMMITADSNAPRGTYLVILPSIGVDSFLLTVGDQPYHE